MNWILKILNRKLNERIEILESAVQELTEDRDALVAEIGEISVYCDKCDGGNSSSQCFKCSDTGIIKKKQLYDWPW